ncbi:MAG: heme-binding protein [Rhodoferax sp.]|nr:heme-binding protein [Rhodoferax sp.]
MASLTLAQALQIIEVALAKARADGCKPMGIAILDEGGALKAFAREDGASMFRFEVAQAKAWGAVGMGVASRALGQRAKDNPNFFVSLAATAHGKFLPQTGAVVIKDASGQVIGAAGASGGTGDEDEAVCIAGIEAAGLAHG